jgi:hypothetical protein
VGVALVYENEVAARGALMKDLAKLGLGYTRPENATQAEEEGQI